MNKLLIVDDEKSLLFALTELFESASYEVAAVPSAEEALHKLETENIQIAIIDYHLPKLNGLELLDIIKEKYQWIEVILITAFGSEGVAIDAIKKGAYDYVSKPFDNEALMNRVAHLAGSINQQTDELERGFGYYFSPVMKGILEKVRTVAVTDVPILITGESGTGKELVARMCHHYSKREGRFISVNCSALPENLIESELFGAEKGSFTGANAQKKGYFELAHEGSIFLDEIGDMPVDMQAKLLRVLQEGEIVRIGGGLPVKINSRVMAATNKTIKEEIKNNRFRDDLYYRLNVIEIQVPPLRDRRDEIEPLACMLLKEFNQKYQKNIKGFEPQVIKEIISYQWPGNIRELRNKIEQAVVLCPGEWINRLTLSDQTGREKGTDQTDQLTFSHSDRSDKRKTCLQGDIRYDLADYPELLTKAKKKVTTEFERQFILYHLNRNDWNVKATSDKIGLCRQDLYKKMKTLGIKKEVKYQ